MSNEDVPQLVIGGLYKHWKGADYVVENVALDLGEQTGKRWLVLYRRFWLSAKVYARPIEEFLGEVLPGVKRFVLTADYKPAAQVTYTQPEPPDVRRTNDPADARGDEFDQF